jgi:ADP-ribose pyrophosphatase
LAEIADLHFMSFETIKSELIFEGRVFDVRSDQVKLPDGQITNLDIVVHGGAVVAIPVDEKGNIWFVRQYRHAAGTALVELPAGSVEEGEDLFECTQRELREEIGMAAGFIEKIGAFYLAPGYSTELLHIFLARELSPDPLPGDKDEILQAEKYSIPEAYTMAAQGIIQDAKSLASLLLAQPLLKKL